MTKKPTKRMSKAKAAKPIMLTRGTAIFVGALYGGSASAVSFYTAHYALPLAKSWSAWLLACTIVLAGLVLSAPTCYKTIVKIKGEDMLGKITSVGMVILFEASMTFLHGGAANTVAAYCVGALVLILNAWSGAQQAQAKMVRAS